MKFSDIIVKFKKKCGELGGEIPGQLGQFAKEKYDSSFPTFGDHPILQMERDNLYVTSKDQSDFFGAEVAAQKRGVNTPLSEFSKEFVDFVDGIGGAKNLIEYVNDFYEKNKGNPEKIADFMLDVAAEHDKNISDMNSGLYEGIIIQSASKLCLETIQAHMKKDKAHCADADKTQKAVLDLKRAFRGIGEKSKTHVGKLLIKREMKKRSEQLDVHPLTVIANAEIDDVARMNEMMQGISDSKSSLKSKSWYLICKAFYPNFIKEIREEVNKDLAQISGAIEVLNNNIKDEVREEMKSDKAMQTEVKKDISRAL